MVDRNDSDFRDSCGAFCAALWTEGDGCLNWGPKRKANDRWMKKIEEHFTQIWCLMCFYLRLKQARYGLKHELEKLPISVIPLRPVETNPF